VKRSGRDEPMWVTIPTLHGSNPRNLSVLLSLPQTNKNAMSFLLSLMFSLQQNWRKRGQNRFFLEAGVGGLEEGGAREVA
jgi:hypothetical protein